MDLKSLAKYAAIAGLLASAWFLVKALKPREAELQVIDTRSGEFGDMSSAAQKRAAGAGNDADVSGLDMVPTSSLPLAGPDRSAPPAPAAAPVAATPAPAAEPEPAPAPSRPARREKPRLQATESTTSRPAATSSAFMAAPEDEERKGQKK
ncbi:hypothetical protein EPO15_16905 [bacterium]|nr:MAG: hypothetical protein EPO15_16905 [bacterium]